MKAKLLLTALAILLFASCSKTEIEIEIEPGSVAIRTIGNHQYLFYMGNHRGGVCHYEDCEYCKTIKQND